MTDPIALVLSKLPDAKPVGDGKWSSRCPAHDDRRPSLSIARADNGNALLTCHAGCLVEAITAAMDLKPKDLFAQTDDRTPNRRGKKMDVSARHNGDRKPAKVYPTSADAVAELERQFGRRAADWIYHDANGEPVGMVVRWDLPGDGKDIRPISHHGDGWRIAAMSDPRPLYGLPKLAAAQRVVVCEGEKSADAFRSLGFTATTSAGGSQAASKSDWRPLAGKESLVFPDNDAAGRKYAAAVAEKLAGLPATVVKVVALPGLPDGGDIVEFIEAARAAGMDVAAIRESIERLAATSKVVSPTAETKKSASPYNVRYMPDVICLADVDAKPIHWLWNRRIPIGRLTLLVGRPGAGKSFLTCDIASRLSRAISLPDGTSAAAGDTLFICAEDDPADTIVPRLTGAEADRRRIHLLRAAKLIEVDGKETSVAFDLRNVDLIRDALDTLPHVRLVVIDPIGSYLGGQVDAHRDNEVRSVLMPLASLAMECGVAILLVCHTRKAPAAYADDMALGSRAFVGLARTVLHLSEDTDDRDRKLLLPGKCNLSIPAPGLAFRICGDPTRLEWEPKPLEGMHADDVLAASADRVSSRGPAPVRRDAAAEWLAELLRFGPVAVKEIKESAKAAELAWRTVRRASEVLGVIREKQTFSGGWTWRLRNDDHGQLAPSWPSNDELGHLRKSVVEIEGLPRQKLEDGQVSDNVDTFDSEDSEAMPNGRVDPLA